MHPAARPEGPHPALLAASRFARVGLAFVALATLADSGRSPVDLRFLFLAWAALTAAELPAVGGRRLGEAVLTCPVLLVLLAGEFQGIYRAVGDYRLSRAAVRVPGLPFQAPRGPPGVRLPRYGAVDRETRATAFDHPPRALDRRDFDPRFDTLMYDQTVRALIAALGPQELAYTGTFPTMPQARNLLDALGEELNPCRGPAQLAAALRVWARSGAPSLCDGGRWYGRGARAVLVEEEVYLLEFSIATGSRVIFWVERATGRLLWLERERVPTKPEELHLYVVHPDGALTVRLPEALRSSGIL